MPRSGPPNFVVLVLDCVRASDFPGGTPGIDRMPFCSQLIKESVLFPRATSPAPWTIPSHASLFTGLPPWESGCHCKGNIRLEDSVARAPEMLASMGYRTMSLSANTFIQPTFGLIRGFQQAAWGAWWEPYLRVRPDEPPHVAEEGRPAAATASSDGNGQRSGRLVSGSRDLLVQYPFLLEQASRLAQRLKSRQQPVSSGIARWIEPTFSRWVRATPPDRPMFAFVNLLDAHEPYFRVPDEGRPESGWFAYARLKQERLAWMEGRWNPQARELSQLHELYRQMIRGMDKRVQSIVEILREADRWEDTVFILTSDHGQAFGEHGMLFHMSRVDDELIRIPLMVRFPRAASGGSKARGWASLIDVAPTVLEAAGAPQREWSSAVPLSTLVDGERPQPCVSISDGIIWQHFKGHFSPAQVDTYDRVRATAREGDRKVVVDIGSGVAEEFDLRADPGERHGAAPAGSPESQVLLEAARSAGRRIAEASQMALTDEVSDRLQAWGYL